jgi:mono/diheme cytochrome c family protein
MNRYVSISALILVVAVAACSARRGEPLYGPLRITSAAVENGQQVFMRECHQCHPGGEAGLGPSINDKPLPGFLMKLQVRRGIGAMPAFSQEEITPQELDNLVQFLKELRHHSKTGNNR